MNSVRMTDLRYIGPVYHHAPKWVGTWVEQQPWFLDLFNLDRGQIGSFERDKDAILDYIGEHNIQEVTVLNDILWVDIEITPEITLLILSETHQ